MPQHMPWAKSWALGALLLCVEVFQHKSDELQDNNPSPCSEGHFQPLDMPWEKGDAVLDRH